MQLNLFTFLDRFILSLALFIRFGMCEAISFFDIPAGAVSPNKRKILLKNDRTTVSCEHQCSYNVKVAIFNQSLAKAANKLM
jgi:hypothetical protein